MERMKWNYQINPMVHTKLPFCPWCYIYITNCVSIYHFSIKKN